MSAVTILHADRGDPIARIARANGKAGDVRVLHLDDWLQLVQPRPWPQMLALRADASGAPIVGKQVVNRLFTVAATATGRCLEQGSRNERWLHVHLQQVFEPAAWLAYEPGVRGISRALLPLNLQWSSLRREAGIRVPRFVYGFGFQRPDTAGLRNPMQKSIWSLFDWDQERHLPSIEAARHQFFVERPSGEPVLACFLGEHVCEPRHPHGQPLFLAAADAAELRRICQAARRVFRAEAGELLLYRDEQGWVFHAFSPHLRSAQQMPDFELRARAWIEDLCSPGVPVGSRQTAGHRSS